MPSHSHVVMTTDSQKYTLWAGLYHGPWSRTMEDGLFPGPIYWKINLQSLWTRALTRCKLNVDQEVRMTTHQKINVLIFCYLDAQKGQFKKRSKVKPLFCLHLFFPNEISLENQNHNIISLPWLRCFFLP